MARRRHRLHHRRADAGDRRLRHHPLRRRHRRAQRPDLERAADARRRDQTPLDIADYVWSDDAHEAADLHQHAEGVAAEHARRLLGADTSRSGGARSRSAPAHPRVADVREVLARCDARRLRARQQHLRRAARRRPRHAADDRRIGNDHQRHVGLGLRRRVRRSRRLPLQPGRQVDRLLAVRQHRRRHLLADQQHRHAVSGRSPGFRIRRPAPRTRRRASAW